MMQKKIIFIIIIQLILCFFSYCANPNQKKPSPADLQMIIAINNNDLEGVKIKLSEGADINAFDKTGYSALHNALSNGYSKIANFLIEKGADIKAKTIFGESCLHLVKDKKLANFFIKNGLDVNEKNNEYAMTPLFYHEVDIAKLLIEAGANINAKSKSQNTVLIWFTYNNYIEGVIFLLKNGADINAKNRDRNSALQIATNFHHEKIIKILSAKLANNKIMFPETTSK